MPYTAQITVDGVLIIQLSGEWDKNLGLVTFDAQALDAAAIGEVRFDATELGSWDSALLVFVLTIERWAEQHQLTFALDSLPQQLGALIGLAMEIPQRKDMARHRRKLKVLESIGQSAQNTGKSALRSIDFIGQLFISLGDLFRGRCRFRRADLLQFLDDCGPRSLGITGMISFLMGVILAFVGAMQLDKFGAGIYVASLVGVSLTREMAAMMTGIIMAGRTGAAYAAQLGSMQVNEEIDALRTLGVNPFNYLVMPRLLALTLMMPLLTVYATASGMLGGALVSVSLLDLSFRLFMDKMIETVPLYYFGLGLFKSVMFGLLVALTGCYMGLNSGRSATAVGQATTSAVVVSIVLIVAADSVVTVITTLMGV